MGEEIKKLKAIKISSTFYLQINLKPNDQII